MTQQEFIEQIAKYVQIYAPKYNLSCNSAIIAQACLESKYGTSDKVIFNGVYRHNYFGLKYRKNRVTCHNGYFNAGSKEQNADGSYTPGDFDWYKFESMEKGVEGYCQFVTTGAYKAQNISDPRAYLQKLKDGSYATSLDYVDKVMNVVNNWGLTKYDKINNTEIKGGNSSLVVYTKISPNKTSPRNHKIDTITIHCMAGNLTVESCGNVFAPESRKASSNYGIDSNGRIGMYVEEKDRSWCSSNADNDNRAITIEVANDGGAPDWHVSDKAMESLIKLCADICKRNDIKKLLWQGDKNLIGQIDKQNMTVHRWFKPKACPGDYLYNKHGYIADEVNKLLGAGTPVKPIEQPKPEAPQVQAAAGLYRVRKTWEDASSQIGAYSILANARNKCTLGYKVFDEKGNIIYDPFLVKVTADALNIRSGPGIEYPIKGTIRDKGKYTIMKTNGNWGELKSGMGWISLSYCERV